MTIQQLSLNGFRSIRNVQLILGRVNVISGPNGCGKSNLYKAVRLIHEAASGRLSLALAEEGGIQNAMWAGGARLGDKRGDPKRMILSATVEDFDYEIQLGFPPQDNDDKDPSMFTLDPLVKRESLWLSGHGRRNSMRLLERVNQTAFLTNVQGERAVYPAALYAEESVFGQLSDPHLYPELSQAREILRQWRFYHEFAVWPGSPLRAPQIGISAPVLAHDGSNLASAFRTIHEVGNRTLLYETLAHAFPDSTFQVQAPQGRFQLVMHREGILRPLEAAELSDGTLRFLCLAVAMLSPRPPSLMALNEPENSLHPDLLPALAQLIAEASRYSQLWVTSHSSLLAGLIAEHCAVTHYQLTQQQGETVVE